MSAGSVPAGTTSTSPGRLVRTTLTARLGQTPRQPTDRTRTSRRPAPRSALRRTRRNLLRPSAPKPPSSRFVQVRHTSTISRHGRGTERMGAGTS